MNTFMNYEYVNFLFLLLTALPAKNGVIIIVHCNALLIYDPSSWTVIQRYTAGI